MDLTVVNMPGSESWLYEQEREERNGPPVDEAVLRFYGPEGEEGYNGLTLKKFINMSDEEFAQSYCFQGVLFPLLESGFKNAAGPPITKLCFEQFNGLKKNSADNAKLLRDNLRKAYHRCLDFLRFTFLDKNEGDGPKAFPGKYAIAVPRSDHKFFKNRLGSEWRESYDQQYKWLARVIKCCRVLGLEKEAWALYFGIRYLYRKDNSFETLPRPPAIELLHTAAIYSFSTSIDDYFSCPVWIKDYDEDEEKISRYLDRDEIKKYIVSLDWVNGDLNTIEERYNNQVTKDAEEKKAWRQHQQKKYCWSDSYTARESSESEYEEDSDTPCLDWKSDDESDYETRNTYFDRYDRVRRGVALDQYGDPVNPDAEESDDDSEEDAEDADGDESDGDESDGDESDGDKSAGDGSAGDESTGEEAVGDEAVGAQNGDTEARAENADGGTENGDADDESEDEDDATDPADKDSKPSNLKRKRDDHDDDDGNDPKPPPGFPPGPYDSAHGWRVQSIYYYDVPELNGPSRAVNYW